MSRVYSQEVFDTSSVRNETFRTKMVRGMSLEASKEPINVGLPAIASRPSFICGDGWTVLGWDEFKALCLRVGIDPPPFSRAVFNINLDETATVTFDHRNCLKLADDGWEVFRWKEFIQLGKRLGVDFEIPTTKLTIVLERGEAAKIIQEFLASDINQPEATTPFDGKDSK